MGGSNKIISGLIIPFVVINCLWPVEASSPVVLWTVKRIGEGSVESNLNEFSSQQFADLLAWKTEQGNVPIIAFGLESLSLEDLSPEGGMGGSVPFRKLRRITDASAETLLFPAVQSAAESMSILEGKGYQVYQINAGDVLPKLESANSILIINEQAGVNMDDEVLRVFSKYSLDFTNIIGMLWGRRSTWTEEPEDEVNEILSRKKRQATPPPENETPPIKFSGNGVFMVARKVVLAVSTKADRKTVDFTKATVSASFANASDFVELNMNFQPPANANVSVTKFELKMTFVKSLFGYWSMNESIAKFAGADLPAEAILFSPVDLTVHETRSFHCSRFGSLVRKGGKADNQTSFYIDIIGFQIQAFMSDSTSEKFVEAYECVGFFTPGIWMGIVVTIMLIAILTWGMKMIMDVKTMDKFDDPKGKPISFGGTE